MRISESPATPAAKTRYRCPACGESLIYATPRCPACNEEAPVYNLPVFWRWLTATGALFGSVALWEMFS